MLNINRLNLKFEDIVALDRYKLLDLINEAKKEIESLREKNALLEEKIKDQ